MIVLVGGGVVVLIVMKIIVGAQRESVPYCTT